VTAADDGLLLSRNFECILPDVLVGAAWPPVHPRLSSCANSTQTLALAWACHSGVVLVHVWFNLRARLVIYIFDELANFEGPRVHFQLFLNVDVFGDIELDPIVSRLARAVEVLLRGSLVRSLQLLLLLRGGGIESVAVGAFLERDARFHRLSG